MIKKFDNFLKGDLFKSKDELDILSKSDINDFKKHFIENMGYGGKVGDNKESRKYLDELGLYYDVRFKEDKYDRYKRWVNTYNSDKEGNSDLESIVGILSSDGGMDQLYYLSINSQLEKIGTFEYINEINIQIPEKFKKV